MTNLAPAPQGADLNDGAKLALLRRLAVVGNNKLLTPEEVFTLMSALVGSSGESAAPVHPVQAPQPSFQQVQVGLPMQAAFPKGSGSPSGAAQPAQAVQAETPREWVLDGGKTLRANLEDWLRVAGYEPLGWHSSAEFTVGGAKLTGTFQEVLAELAKAVPGLDFMLSTSRRSLTVKDAAA